MDCRDAFCLMNMFIDVDLKKKRVALSLMEVA